MVQFHQPHLQSSMPRLPHLSTPPVSCFSGITVCLKTISPSPIKASRQIPAKLVVKHKDMGPADIGFTVVVSPVTMQQVCGTQSWLSNHLAH